MKVKDGVSVKGCKGVMFHAAVIAERVFRNYGYAEAIITGGDEDGHKTRKHPDGEGLDFRVWHLSRISQQLICDDLKRELGPEYDVVLEDNPPHIHVEYDPK